MIRRLAVTILLAACAACSARAASEPRFQPGLGLASLDSGATGVYELGTVQFGNESGRLQALVHHGRVLQVHCRHDDRWLAKRSGSTGGKAVAPTKFDELATIAGGLNRDVRRAPAMARASFARAAGLVFFGDGSTADGPSAASRNPRRWQPRLVPTAQASSCGSIGCRAIYRHGAAGAERFIVASDTENGLWGFEGYGIVAIWPMPQPN